MAAADALTDLSSTTACIQLKRGSYGSRRDQADCRKTMSRNSPRPALFDQALADAERRSLIHIA